jgi:hypothetical protein
MMNVATARWPVYPSTKTIEQTGCRTDAKKANPSFYFIQLGLLQAFNRLSF